MENSEVFSRMMSKLKSTTLGASLCKDDSVPEQSSNYIIHCTGYSSDLILFFSAMTNYITSKPVSYNSDQRCQGSVGRFRQLSIV